MHKILMSVTAALAILPPAGLQAADTDHMPPGKAEYVQMGCKQCHGYQGQGGGNGPRLAPAPLPYEAFAAQVRWPRGVMPAYPPGQLGDAMLKRIYGYLQSQPPPPDADDIPALKAVKSD